MRRYRFALYVEIEAADDDAALAVAGSIEHTVATFTFGTVHISGGARVTSATRDEVEPLT